MTNIAEQVFDAINKINSIQPTYCDYLLAELRRALENPTITNFPSRFKVINSQYNANGLMANIRDDKNNQEYIITIEPKRKG